MAKPARRGETAFMQAIYRWHPTFVAESDFHVWHGDVEQDWGRATVEGGDVMPIGRGAVMIGMGERTAPQSVTLIARELFKAGSARLVLAVLITSIALALASFTKRRGLGVAAVLATLVLLNGFTSVLVSVMSMQTSETTASYFAVLDPYLLVDGLAAGWLGVEPQNDPAHPDGALGTAFFTLALVVIVAATVGILIRRFRKVGGV